MKINPNEHISISVKIALAATVLPSVCLAIALLTGAPYPTFVVNFYTGRMAEYVFLMKNTPENLPGAIIFMVLGVFVGLGIIMVKHLKLNEMGHELAKDWARLIPHQPTGSTLPESNPADITTAATESNDRYHVRKTTSSFTLGTKAPETTP